MSNGHGGKRKGAGRPKGTGQGRGKDARYNRVAVMFSDAEIKELRRRAKVRGIPVATLVHSMLKRRLAK